MKKILLAAATLLGIWSLEPGTCAFAQSSPPPGINYQAVARDVAGAPLSNQTVTVTFRIRQASAVGVAVYRGTQNYPTNLFGLFNAVIGQTASDSGAFAAIPWASNVFFLQVLVNGNNMGATQLLTVPYAFHSSTTDSLTNPPPGAFLWKRIGDSLLPQYNRHRVGIGTRSPTEMLQVSDSVGMAPYVALHSPGGSFNIGYKIKTVGGTNEWLLGKDNGEFDMFKIKSKIGLAGFTGFSMTSGKVGIGTNSPQDFFHVRPDKDFTFDSTFVVTSDGKVGIGIITPAGKLHVKDIEISNGLDDDGDGITDETTGFMVFTTKGQLGLSTSTPAAGTMMDVNGTIRIQGGAPGNGKVLSSDATGLASWSSSPLSNFTVCPTAGTFTFTVPAGVYKIMVEVWGGGGGGAGAAGLAAGGGGGGGYGKNIVAVTPGTNYTVTVGAGGNGGASGSGGGNGGTSTVNTSPSVSAAGGIGGGATGTGGSGGSSGAPVNITGSAGKYGGTNFISYGGNSGNGGSGGLGGIPGTPPSAGLAPGGGGGGAYAGAGMPGSSGANGRVVIWW